MAIAVATALVVSCHVVNTPLDIYLDICVITWKLWILYRYYSRCREFGIAHSKKKGKKYQIWVYPCNVKHITAIADLFWHLYQQTLQLNWLQCIGIIFYKHFNAYVLEISSSSAHW